MSDCIERDAVVSLIEERQKALCPAGLFSRHSVYGSDREKFDAWGEIIDAIQAIPTVDPVKHGGWIKPVPGDGVDRCSICKAEPPWFAPYGYYEPDYLKICLL